MKKHLLIIAISVFALQGSFAQTASDYYLPLCVGNYLKFYTPGVDGGWGARTTFYRIIQTDNINNEVFYLLRGTEIMDSEPNDSSVFMSFWLRKDNNGEILIGAYDENGSGVLSSAIITSPGSVFLSNQFLKLNYSETTTMGEGETSTDSVISVSATVDGYTNCLQIRNIVKSNGKLDRMEDSYHALHMGIVKQERIFPGNEMHVNSLVDFVAVNCYQTDVSEIGKAYHHSIYPNPFSSSTTLQANGKFKDAILTVYNAFGQTVKQIDKLSGQTITFYRDNLPSGLYYLRLTEGHKTLSVDKLIITD